MKCQALFAMGHLEYALMFFHRVARLSSSSNNRQAAMGVQRCQEAIKTAVTNIQVNMGRRYCLVQS